MHRLYEAPAYDTGQWPPSFWRASLPAPEPAPPLRGQVRVEVAVIGAGYAGLSAALELARRHGRQVAVIDAAQPGWGASGRNGGFCCHGGAKLSDHEIVARVGEGGARDFRDFQHRAIELVAERLSRYRIDARQGPEGDICLAHSPAAFAELAKEAKNHARLYGETHELIRPGELAERGLGGRGFHGAMLIGSGFPIHPLAYAEGLARAARDAGAVIFGDSPVTRLSPQDGRWRLESAGGEIIAKRVLIATNGYSSEDLPGWLGGRTLPAFSAIMVTRPITPSEKRAQNFTTPIMSYDSRRLLHYFRHLPDGRFLFGMRGGTSAAPAAVARNAKLLRSQFEAIFPAWAGVESAYEWSGLVCLTSALAPYVGPVPGAEGLYAALGWHGNGVAPASLGGTLAADLLAGTPVAIPALMRQPLKRFPMAGLRRLALKMAYLHYGRQDGPLPRD